VHIIGQRNDFTGIGLGDRLDGGIHFRGKRGLQDVAISRVRGPHDR
jgi:hypothetical protein